MALQHVVLFKFAAPLDEATEREMRGLLAAFPERIGELTRLRFGADLTGGRTDGYSYLLHSEFPDDAALQRYRAHPVHQDFLNWLADHDGTLLGFDYNLDESTVLMPEA